MSKEERIEQFLKDAQNIDELDEHSDSNDIHYHNKEIRALAAKARELQLDLNL